MMVGDRVTGVISIQSLEKEHAFDQDQARVLASIASQAAVAIENARFYQGPRRRIRELEVVTDMGGIASILGIDEILDLLYGQMDKIMDLNKAQVLFAFHEKAKDLESFPLAVGQDRRRKSGSGRRLDSWIGPPTPGLMCR